VIGESTTLPLPVISLTGRFAITKKLFLKQSIDFFWIGLDDFEGTLIDTMTALEYNLFKHFGLGIAGNILRVKVSGDSDSAFLGGGWQGNLKFDYAGIMLYGKLYF
jgi:hypothetical protein